MNSWAMAVLAVALTAVAVVASIVIPRVDRTGSRPTDAPRATPGVAFTVIDDTDPSPTPSASPSAPPRPDRGAESAEDTDAAERPPQRGPRRVSVQSGEIEEASTDQDQEEAEAERELEEREARAEAREDRRNRDD